MISENRFWVLVIGIAILITFPWSLDVKKGRFDLFNPKNVFLLYLLLQFSAGLIIVYLLDTYVLYGRPLRFLSDFSESFEKGQIYVACGLVAFHFGYYVRLGSRSKKAAFAAGSTQPRLPQDLSSGRTYLLFFFSILIMIASFSALVERS